MAFDSERVLEHAIASFAETIELKIKQLRRYVPKKKELTNPELTGAYIEELVRGFVRDWIGHRQLLTGTLFSEHEVDAKPMQIDGIVFDPTKGPTGSCEKVVSALFIRHSAMASSRSR